MLGGYDDQTEVLTRVGWKLWGEVGECDELAAIDPGSGEMD